MLQRGGEKCRLKIGSFLWLRGAITRIYDQLEVFEVVDLLPLEASELARMICSLS